MADIGILENVPLAGYSTFRCGGPARYFAEPATGDEVARLFRLAGEQNWDVFILGNGSNCLISDEGFDGLVIRIGKNMSELKSEELEDGRVKITAGAGFLMQDSETTVQSSHLRVPSLHAAFRVHAAARYS